MFGCAGGGYGAPFCGGGDGDGGGCAGVSLVQSSGVALPLLFGPPQPSPPELVLKGTPGPSGSHWIPSSWRPLTSCSFAHPRKINATQCHLASHIMHTNTYCQYIKNFLTFSHLHTCICKFTYIHSCCYRGSSPPCAYTGNHTRGNLNIFGW